MSRELRKDIEVGVVSDVHKIHASAQPREVPMTALAFSTAAYDAEATRLADGRTAVRTYNARKGVWGWVIYGWGR